MSRLRAAIILFVFVLVTLAGIPWQAWALRFGLARRKTFPHRYHRFLARLLDLRICVIGTPVQGSGALIVANHSSWLDIVAFSAAAQVSFVAKSEVQSWPFFSTLARLQETVFVERARRAQTGQARNQIRERLLSGDTLVLFPEGTSDDGNAVLSFKSALMGAAEANIGTDNNGVMIPVPVQPVSITYTGLHGIPMGRESRPLFAWYGDMELVPHLWEALVCGPIDVVIEFHPPTNAPAAGGRKALAIVAENMVRRGHTRALADFQRTTGKAGENRPAEALVEAAA